jgi:group II intron reverse transcriptase/maturase
MESGGPKRGADTNGELGDYLRGSFSSLPYGNGVLIVGAKPKGDRRYSLINPQKYSGFRYYSKVAEATEGDLPRRYEKLVNFYADATAVVKAADIYPILFKERMYEIAYHKLKSNPGNMTPGVDGITLDGFSREDILEIIEQMKTGKFQFKPGKRKDIPKSSGGSRPLTMAPPRDKVVQEVMRMIIEAIFEPTLSDNSHGFRTGRSCHTALRQIRRQFGASSFYIEGDISKCFDSFDHHTLIRLIKERIVDERFIQLVWKSLRAGYMEFHVPQHSIIGTPQGSIVSPILANIYLHPLDEFVEELKADYDKGETARINPIYRRWENMRYKALKANDTEKALRCLKEMLKVNARMPNDPDFRRLYYVRYADDWIIAIRGKRSEAVSILSKIGDFLSSELKLRLSLDKSKITDPKTDYGLFLGTLIGESDHTGSYRGSNHQSLRTTGQVRMLAPMDRIYKKLDQVGLVDIQKKCVIPKFIWYANDKDTIITLYNSVRRGYLNYYSFVNNYQRVAVSLEFLLKGSCAKLLAAKYKLGSVSKVLAKYGKDLKGNDRIAFLKPSYNLKVWDFKVNAKDRIKTLFASHLSAATLNSLSCSNCGSTTQVEMHHVRLLKDLNPKLSLIDKMMAARRRKQIPLCRPCHLTPHKNHKSWGTGRRKGPKR